MIYAVEKNWLRVENLVFNLDGFDADIDCIFWDRAWFGHIEGCAFIYGSAGSYFIRGGSWLYSSIRQCSFNHDPYAIYLLESESSGSAYYGLNVGVIAENYFNGLRAIKIEGICQIVSNAFEGQLAEGNGFVDIGDSYQSQIDVIGCYWECSAGDVPMRAIYYGTSCRGRVENNQIFGAGKTESSSYGILLSLIVSSSGTQLQT